MPSSRLSSRSWFSSCAHRFLLASFIEDAGRAIRAFAPGTVITFDIPREAAFGGPYDGATITGPDLHLSVMDLIIGTTVEFFILSNCADGSTAIIDTMWARGNDRYPVRMEFTTSDGRIAALRFSERDGPTPCDL